MANEDCELRLSLRSIWVLGLLQTSFVLACFIHGTDGWKRESFHGGLWKTCNSDLDTCWRYHSSKLRAARAVLVMDAVVVAVLYVPLSLLYFGLEGKALIPMAAVLGFLHFMFLTTGCSILTEEFTGALNASLDYDTVLWDGMRLLFLAHVPSDNILFFEERRSANDEETPTS
ncbi:uncharacterized protein LOC142342451 [Convolutriloba macropyga]|uniref:uncharacterized protein LOC142342451 n=1 Tax=Convolutriloba macropyga TaxID=536237 RepID=UPI003F5210FC